MAKRVRAYIGLGSNLGDSQTTLRNAVRALAALPGVRLRAVSPLYRTRPVGVTDQPDFLNAVVALDVPVRVLTVGRERDNQAIAALAVRADPSGLKRTLFASVANSSASIVVRRLQILADGTPVTARDIVLDPLTREPLDDDERTEP